MDVAKCTTIIVLFVSISGTISGQDLIAKELRIQRAEPPEPDYSDGESFGQMLNAFMSNLFGSAVTPTDDVLNTPLNESDVTASTSDVVTAWQSNMTNNVTSFPVNETQLSTPPIHSSDSYNSMTPYSTTTFTRTATTGFDWYDDTDDVQQENAKCFVQLPLQEYCDLSDPLKDVTFWDIYSVLFSDAVIDALLIGCTKGTWCLKDRFDYWEALIMERVDMTMQSDIANSLCQGNAMSCLENVLTGYENCSSYGQMIYTNDAIKLICQMKRNEMLTSECYKHALTALHVTLADVMRKTEPEKNEDLCQSPEAEMTRNLICVNNACPEEDFVFDSFSPWAWFTYVKDDLINRCDLDPNKCMSMLQPEADLIYRSELSTMISVSLATMITAVVLAFTVSVCYKRHRRNVALKEGYEKLLNEGDES